MFNRYVLGQDLIESPYVLSVDDDVVLTEDLIMCIVTASQNYPQRLIGTDLERVADHSTNVNTNEASILHGTTLMMTKSMRRLMRDMPMHLRNNITNPASPCYAMDDILVNGLHAEMTGAGPVIVSRGEYPSIRFTLPAPTHAKPAGKREIRRSECLEYTKRFFNYQSKFVAAVRCPCGRGFYGSDECYACEDGTYTRAYARPRNECTMCPATIAEAGIFPEYLPTGCRNIGMHRTLLVFAVLVFPVAYMLLAFFHFVRKKMRDRDPRYNYNANKQNEEYERELDDMLKQNGFNDV
jgi:hypothetical protein